MLIQIDPRRGVPLYRQVMDQVTRLIMSGQLGEGEQLESVASLAERLRINPMTVSKAYGFLVESGLLERRPGVGLFVRPVQSDQRRQIRNQLLDDTIGRSAALAVQLGLDEESATRLFTEQFRQMKSRQERVEE